ncbi:F0F1 ATP synthase subunit delta [Bacillus pinisoli]|uniref:F0F1 ATP synthase subunit delta n=1 Tax=Bacillus pinisoli TaxID=2901866 RepID=UPI001FF54C27|nr:F0F1 ATP synthase subunit delta [Bacillus pinisoli]
MSNGTVAKRYATALFQVAKEQNILEQVENELLAVKTVFQENKELLSVLNHPKVSKVTKKSLVKDSFANVSAPVLNVLLILIDRHRQAIIPGVVDFFIEEANNERGIADAKVYSVRELTEDEKTSLSQAFASKVGKASLRIQNIVDPTVLGGVKLRIGNRIYDGSVSGKLARVERELLNR